jgi:hypothetical protein
MTIQVELNSESEARLTAEAHARGVALETYASKLLQEVLLSPGRQRAKLTKDKYHAMLRVLADGSERLPELPTEGFARESFYEDRT